MITSKVRMPLLFDMKKAVVIIEKGQMQRGDILCIPLPRFRARLSVRACRAKLIALFIGKTRNEIQTQSRYCIETFVNVK